MTDFVKDEVGVEQMIAPQDVAEMARLLLRFSPACVITEIQLTRPGGATL